MERNISRRIWNFKNSKILSIKSSKFLNFLEANMEHVDKEIIKYTNECLVPIEANEYFPVDIKSKSPTKPLRRFPHSEYLESILHEQQSRSKFSVFKQANEWEDFPSDLKYTINRTMRKVVSLDGRDDSFELQKVPSLETRKIIQFITDMDRIDSKRNKKEYKRTKVFLDLSVDEIDSMYLNGSGKKVLDYLSLIDEAETSSEDESDSILIDFDSKDDSKEREAKI